MAMRTSHSTCIMRLVTMMRTLTTMKTILKMTPLMLTLARRKSMTSLENQNMEKIT